MEKLLKELGYGYCISYNSYRNVWVVFKLNEWDSSFPLEESKVCFDEDPEKALKKYIDKYL